MSTAAPLRPLRGMITGLTCGVGAVAAHSYAGAGAPTALGWVGTLSVCLVAAHLLSKRRFDPAALLGITLLGQGLLHTAFHTDSTWAMAPMVAGHVLAALLTTWLAAGAETALWRLATRLWCSLVPPAPVCVVLRRAVHVIEWHQERAHHGFIGRASSVRGPPALIVCPA
ncbi:MAG: hypothetical protein V9E81_04625 [Marmoricola sp.]